nr:MAG TPA: hypothetical protein [Caudoviricetes sp.]
MPGILFYSLLYCSRNFCTNARASSKNSSGISARDRMIFALVVSSTIRSSKISASSSGRDLAR